MSDVLQGVIRGNTIELDSSPGIEDGQIVEVVLRPISAPEDWGEGLRRCAGALANDREVDAILAEVERERKGAMFREDWLSS